MLQTLKHNRKTVSFLYANEKKWSDRTEFTLLEIFDLLAPYLMIEASSERCRNYLGFMLKPNKDKEINLSNASPLNRIKEILADLNALEIIKPSIKKHPISDKNEYWTLTTEGKKLFKEVRREILDKNVKISINIEDEKITEIKNIKKYKK